MGHVAALWRHPIKSHGREALETVSLTTGQTMPWDRRWAVAHEAAKFDAAAPAWVPCQNFMRGTQTPALAGIWAQLDEATASITLRHADLEPITFAPDDAADAARFVEWVAPLCAANRASPAGIVTIPGRGMTDSDFPSIAIMNTASHMAVAAKAGQALEQERWRGNIWLDGLDAWDEHGWLGQTLRVGSAELIVRERIGRCVHIDANPQSGLRDTRLLDVLETDFGHRDFGIYAEVFTGGTISVGDTAEVV